MQHGPTLRAAGRGRAGRVSRRTADTARAESLGEAKWSEVFRDAELQKLIRKAVEENNDVHIAAARVLQARAQLTITRADQLPTVAAEATATKERTPTTTRRMESRFRRRLTASIGVDGTLFWELDFWGKFRNATEAEKATLLGTQWAARAVLVSVVSSVAQSYFTLRELDLELEIAQRALAAREESLRLTRVQEAGGVVSLLDVRQAEQLVYTAASVITEHGTPDHAAGERAQHSAGAEPRPDSAWPSVGRSAGAARGAAGLPSSAARAATGHPSGRAGVDRSERSHWRREGRAVSADHPDSRSGLSEQRAVDADFRAGRALAHVTGNLVQQIFDGGRLRANVG